MKAIIYAGIGLFSAASVYGVVDYYNSKSNGTLDKIYKEETPAPVTEKETKQVAATTVNVVSDAKKEELITKKLVSKTAKKKSKKSKEFVREFKFSNFSRGRLIPTKVIEEEEKPAATVKEEIKE
jgi:intein/homing endonuclease